MEYKNDNERVLEWRPIDHMPLINRGKLNPTKLPTGYFTFREIILVIPAWFIINYTYQPLENQFVYGTGPFLRELVEYLFKHIDKKEAEIIKLKNQVTALAQKAKVCDFF